MSLVIITCITQLLFQLVDLSSDNYLSLMDDSGDIRDDIKLPEGDIGKDIKTKFENDEQFMVTVLKAMGEEVAIGIKAMTK